MTSVSIIGLGWLGEPLAKTLLEHHFSVKGSTTSEDKWHKLKSAGMQVSRLAFKPHPEGRDFQRLFHTDVLVVNIPPKTRSNAESFHPEQIKYLRELAEQAGVKRIIYVSATSVYPDLGQIARECDELTLENTGNRALFQAETLLWKEKSYDLTVLRLGGLLGADRIPVSYFSGKSNVVGDTPVNYIHRDDAVKLIHWIIEKELWNFTFNGVAPLHPNRREVYEKNVLELDIKGPESYATDVAESWKEISAEKILKTGFKFDIPDPLDFWYEKYQ